MRYIRVALTELADRALAELAAAELRDPRRQAAWILLEQLGLKPDGRAQTAAASRETR